MTFTLRQEHIGRYSVGIYQDKFSSVFRVELSEERGAYYYTVKSCICATRKNANATFNRYKRAIND